MHARTHTHMHAHTYTHTTNIQTHTVTQSTYGQFWYTTTFSKQLVDPFSDIMMIVMVADTMGVV